MSTAEIWHVFHDRLRGFVHARVKDEAATDDIVQEVFEKIHLKLPSLKDQTRLTSWVFQITRNAIVDHFRKLKHQKPLDDGLADEPQQDEKDFSHCMLALIDHLDPKYKQAIVAADVKGLSQKELAAELGISYSAAKSRVQRARVQVKDGLVKCCKVVTDGYGHVVSDEPCANDCGC